jgi:uncharacterized OB-fold protein
VQRVDAVCPRCGKRPSVRVALRGDGAVVTLTIRCEECRRRGWEVIFTATMTTCLTQEPTLPHIVGDVKD